MSIKEVRYDLYCSKCVNCETPETEEPCNDCLTNSTRDDSHKPVRFKEKEIKKK